MVDGKCTPGWVIEGRWAKLTSNTYGVFEFVVHYMVHTTALVYLYGKVIRMSRTALSKNEETTSTATQKV